MPKVTEAFDADKNNDGSFNFPTWAMNVGRDQLDKASVDADEARELTATIYHEARHTEQWFRMAQLRAAQGLSAAGIATEMGIPARIAREAKGKPLTRGSMEAVIAQGWFDSVYGSGAEHREAVLNELRAAGNALRAAQAARDKNPTPATEAALLKARNATPRRSRATPTWPKRTTLSQPRPRPAPRLPVAARRRHRHRPAVSCPRRISRERRRCP